MTDNGGEYITKQVETKVENWKESCFLFQFRVVSALTNVQRCIPEISKEKTFPDEQKLRANKNEVKKNVERLFRFQK